ncbi:L,D-transpeptidase [Streptomyces sp. NPDC021749]|uniref:L,D-transpeptidase n=1 Tax=Streptomyces sp. NPDC021749 TaxID=3154905 RepID=UPI00340D0244
MRIRHRIVPLTAAVVLTGGLAATEAAPALAAHPAPGKSATSTAAGGTYLYFNKNQRHPSKSKLWLMRSIPHAKDQVIAKYRAGSGNGHRNGTNECAKMQGWLPTGDYRVLSHTKRHNGGRSGINGYAIQVQDKVCKDHRTKRTELFVHSEMNVNGTQGPRWPGHDSPYRWDGDNDYFSLGCIKLKPTDIKKLFAQAARSGWPTRLKVVD